MSIKAKFAARLQNHPKRVVFPDGQEPRVLQAARQFATMRLGTPILLGDRERIKELAEQLSIRLDGIRIIEPARSEELDNFRKVLASYRRMGTFDGEELNETSIENYLRSPNYFAALLVLTGGADAMVCGANVMAFSALRPVIQLFPRQPGIETVSSMQVMDLTESPASDRLQTKQIFLADCTVIANPTAQQLAEIAVMTASLYNHLTGGARPKVAFLSYSTFAKSPNESILKLQAALEIARQKAREISLDADFDGEMQADAALNKFIAQEKCPDSTVAGHANVLIFPDLFSANIASKFAQNIADVPCYGQIITGLKKPVAEISRGSSARDILGAAIIVAAQAIDKHYLCATKFDDSDDETWV